MDRYEIVKKIGEGSFGRALVVRSKDTGKELVMKEVNLKSMSMKEKEEARKEVYVLSQLSHCNIVSYVDSFEEQSKLYILMDYCDGGDLYGRINAQRGILFPEEQILDWFVQMCLAVKHIHDRKILHRDIKSQNIFLMRNGMIKIGDFGIAKLLNSTVELAKTCIGTPYYLSPEIVENRPYNNKSDIWSLGCVLYELVTLKHAFEAGSLKHLVLKIVRGSYPPPPSKYSYELRNLISELLRQNPRDRPSVNTLLRKPILQTRIRRFLSNAEIESEFSHTVMHGAKISRTVAPSAEAKYSKYSAIEDDQKRQVVKHHLDRKLQEIDEKEAARRRSEQLEQEQRKLQKKELKRKQEELNRKREQGWQVVVSPEVADDIPLSSPERLDLIPPIGSLHPAVDPNREVGHYGQHHEWLNQFQHRQMPSNGVESGHRRFQDFANENNYRKRVCFVDDFFQRRQEAALNRAKAQGDLYGYHYRMDFNRHGERRPKESIQTVMRNREEQQKKANSEYLAQLEMIRQDNAQERRRMLEKVASEPEYEAKVDETARLLKEESDKSIECEAKTLDQADQMKERSKQRGRWIDAADRRPTWEEETSGQALIKKDLEKTEGSRLRWEEETVGQGLEHLDLESTEDQRNRFGWGDETEGHALAHIDLENTGNPKDTGRRVWSNPSQTILNVLGNAEISLTSRSEYNNLFSEAATILRDDEVDARGILSEEVKMQKGATKSIDSEDFCETTTRPKSELDIEKFEPHNGGESQSHKLSESGKNDSDDEVVNGATSRSNLSTIKSKVIDKDHKKKPQCKESDGKNEQSQTKRPLIRQWSEKSENEYQNMMEKMKSVLQPVNQDKISAGLKTIKESTFETSGDEELDEYFEEENNDSKVEELRNELSKNLGKKKFEKAYEILKEAHESEELHVTYNEEIKKKVTEIFGKLDSGIYQSLLELAAADCLLANKSNC